MNLQEEGARDQAGTKKRNEVLIAFMPQARRDSVTAAAKAQAHADSIAAAEAGPNAAQFARRGGGGGGGGGGRGGPQPKGPFTAAQVQAAIDSGRLAEAMRPAANAQVTEEVDTLNGGVAGYNGTVGGVGGFTALHHAARQGNVEAARALLDGGADINDTSRVDHTTPLLMAAINGQFDVAMLLVQRGANPNIASNVGMTPLYAAINTQWAPKSRYPQPQAIQNQKTTYLELMKALLDAKASDQREAWHAAVVLRLQQLRQRQLRSRVPRRLHGVLARGVRRRRRRDEAAWSSTAPIPMSHPSARRRPAARGGRGGRGGAAGGDVELRRRATSRRSTPRREPRNSPAEVVAVAAVVDAAPHRFSIPRSTRRPRRPRSGAGVYAIHAAAGVGYGNGFAGNSHRHAPDGWMPAMKYLVEELHADVNARDARGMTPLHHAAARGDNDMIQYLVAHGADPRSRVARRPHDRGHGERAGAATPSIPRDDRAAREARREEPAPLRVLLTVTR